MRVTTPLRNQVAAEALGSALLLATVVGSGIMGEQLAAGNTAIALLANSLATGAALVVLITVLGPISGAHFNPVVTLVEAQRRSLPWSRALPFVLAQGAGALAGVGLAHAMFGLEIVQRSAHARTGPSLWLSEVVATFGLLLTILGSVRHAPDRTPLLVGLYITAAYWFTASTSFANPAVSLARAFTATFAGIRLEDVPAFAVAQLVGAALAAVVWPALDRRDSTQP
jgi:glycerol uptake facilitator-like aquaporin